jgi:hypothetical protein
MGQSVSETSMVGQSVRDFPVLAVAADGVAPAAEYLWTWPINKITLMVKYNSVILINDTVIS